MRGYFKRRSHEVPELNTSSLPDLIFTVLFFFMIVTHMREVNLKVKYEVPQGTEVQKQEHKGAAVYIYIGHLNAPQKKAEDKEKYYIQLNNRLASVDEIKTFIDKERSQMNSEDQARMTVSIKADKDVPMGIIADVKKELQRCSALKINYSANEK